MKIQSIKGFDSTSENKAKTNHVNLSMTNSSNMKEVGFGYGGYGESNGSGSYEFIECIVDNLIILAKMAGKAVGKGLKKAGEQLEKIDPTK